MDLDEVYYITRYETKTTFDEPHPPFIFQNKESNITFRSNIGQEAKFTLRSILDFFDDSDTTKIEDRRYKITIERIK